MNLKILAAVAVGISLCACRPHSTPMSAALPSAPAVAELIKTDTVVGTGEPIVAGQIAVVHYTGWLYAPEAPEQKGARFDGSRERGTPFRFEVGQGRVIAGWDRGVVGMQVGGQRRLVIPAFLAYGDRGAGGVIPPNAPLLFEIELLAIEQRK